MNYQPNRRQLLGAGAAGLSSIVYAACARPREAPSGAAQTQTNMPAPQNAQSGGQVSRISDEALLKAYSAFADEVSRDVGFAMNNFRARSHYSDLGQIPREDYTGIVERVKTIAAEKINASPDIRTIRSLSTEDKSRLAALLNGRFEDMHRTRLLVYDSDLGLTNSTKTLYIKGDGPLPGFYDLELLIPSQAELSPAMVRDPLSHRTKRFNDALMVADSRGAKSWVPSQYLGEKPSNYAKAVIQAELNRARGQYQQLTAFLKGKAVISRDELGKLVSQEIPEPLKASLVETGLLKVSDKGNEFVGDYVALNLAAFELQQRIRAFNRALAIK